MKAGLSLIADGGSRVHGVEGPSTDKAGTKEFPNHRVCRDRGMIHYEWLVNLDELNVADVGENADAALDVVCLQDDKHVGFVSMIGDVQ